MEVNKKNLRTFGLASFLNDMGSDMIYPIWPIFLTSVLHAPLAAVGFIDGLGEAVVSISQAAAGYYSDKLRKRKVFIWAGYAMGAFSRLGYALAQTWFVIIPFRILDRAGKIRGAPRNAMVADDSTVENRGRNFGFLKAMDNSGAVVGILITIVWVNTLGLRNIFLLAAIPSFIAALAILVRVKETIPASKIFKSVSFKNFSQPFKLFTASATIFALGAFSYSFLLIYAQRSGFGVGFVPVLYLLFTIVASATSLPFGRLCDRWGRRAVVSLGYALWLLVLTVLIFFSSHLAVVAAFILYGLHRGAIDVSQITYASELADPNFRASSLGALQMLVGLAALPASVVAGVLWDSFGAQIPLVLSLVLTVIAWMIVQAMGSPRRVGPLGA